MDPDMKREMQIKVSRDKAYVDLLINRKRWDDYLAGNYSNTDLYPTYQKWARKPQSQFVLQVTLQRYKVNLPQTDENIDRRQGLVNLIIPRSDECTFTSESSSINTPTSIVNIYREIAVQPPTEWWGTAALSVGEFADFKLCGQLTALVNRTTPIFECDFKSHFQKAIFRIVDIISAVKEIEVNMIRGIDCDMGMVAEAISKGLFPSRDTNKYRNEILKYVTQKSQSCLLSSTAFKSTQLQN